MLRKNYVSIYSNNPRIKDLGSALYNELSFELWNVLCSDPKKEFYLKEMAKIITKHPNPKLPIFEHHIKKLVKAGIVTYTVKMYKKRPTKFYTGIPTISVINNKKLNKHKILKIHKTYGTEIIK